MSQNENAFLKILDRPIAFQRCLVLLTDNVAGALLLSQAIYWQNRCDSDDGWWWKTGKEWFEETGLKRYEFEAARRSCAKFLKHQLRGVPATSFYRVEIAGLQTSLLKVCKLDCRRSANKSAEGLQTISTETSSETSSETIERGDSAQSASPVRPVRFTKPSLEKIKLRGAAIELPEAECEKFFHYYESNGWRVGKNAMKVWTSALANWKQHWLDYGQPNGKERHHGNQATQEHESTSPKGIRPYNPNCW